MVHVLVEELPPAQRLALAYAPRAAREPTLALLALDARLARTLQRKSEPVLAQMRFAWWRDTLAREPEQWPRGDALLALLRQWRNPGALTPLVDGWEMLLGEQLDPVAIAEFAGGRGRAFGQLAAELGADPLAAQACGEIWALGDLAANIAKPSERQTVLRAARPPAHTATAHRAFRARAPCGEARGDAAARRARRGGAGDAAWNRRPLGYVCPPMVGGRS
jgi:phytoene synthase